MGEVVLTKGKENKHPDSLPPAGKNALVHPGAFVFCERGTGTVRFQVEATPSGTLPVEQAASLLAMHCLVRGQTPRDYDMLVVPRGALLEPVGRRAGELLEAGRAIRDDIPLTSREHEVLGWLVRNMSNKQIAARLNVAERTIKFHVSALLAKFKVSDRFGLIRRSMVGLHHQAEEPSPGTLIELPAKPAEPRQEEKKSRRSSAGIGMFRNVSTA